MILTLRFRNYLTSKRQGVVEIFSKFRGFEAVSVETGFDREFMPVSKESLKQSVDNT